MAQEIVSGEVRINGANVFINGVNAVSLERLPPVRSNRNQSGSSGGNINSHPGKAPAGHGATGRLSRARYWTDKNHPERTKQYKALYNGRTALNRRGRPVYEYTNCGRFVHEVVKDDDPNFPTVGTGTMKSYIEKNWTHSAIGEDGSPQPGDVIIVHDSKNGHVGIFGGADPSGGYTVYNASLGGHPPTEAHYRSLNFFRYGAGQNNEHNGNRHHQGLCD